MRKDGGKPAGSGKSGGKKAGGDAGKTGEMKCPECGAAMILRDGKKGKFWGCSRFPKCRKTLEAQDSPQN